MRRSVGFRWPMVAVLAIALVISLGCGDDEESGENQGVETCENRQDCSGGLVCVEGRCQEEPLGVDPCPGEDCESGPFAGDSCGPAQEGDRFDDLQCVGGQWEDVREFRLLAVVVEPPEEVMVGEGFEVSFEVVDGHGMARHIEGVEISLAPSTGAFADDDELMASTDEQGRVEFEVIMGAVAEGIWLTAAVHDEDGPAGSVDTELFDVVVGQASAQTSWITGEDGAVADGVDTAEVVIELRDSFGNPLVGVTPTFSASGEGNTYLPCSETDEEGVATCEMTSTEAGEKALEITDPVQMVGDTIEFWLVCDRDGAPFGGGDGSDDDPYRLCSPGHLNAIGEGTDYLDDSFVVARGINMSEVAGDEFNTIGVFYSLMSADEFTGRFDGGGFAIANLQIERPDDNQVGLFSVVGEGAIIEDVVLTDVVIQGKDHVGSLVGRMREGTIRGASVSGSVVGERFVGGLVGVAIGDVVGSSSQATVEGGHRVGGLVGTGQAMILESHATGEVTGVDGVGGLAGANTGLVQDSYATGEVRGEADVGGLVGEQWPSGIVGSYASGQVTGEVNVGGLVGATNQVLSVGEPDDETVEIRDSYATGEVVGQDSVGGLVGNQKGLIAHCYAAGPVSGDLRVGGLVGLQDGAAQVDDVYWDGDTSGVDTSAAGAILETPAFEDAANFPAWDFEARWSIGTAPDGVTRPILQWQE